MNLRIILAYILMFGGGIFAFITVIGLLRFPDVFTRIHANAVVLTISAVLVTIGVSVYVWELFLSLKILLIAVFFLIANPMATHAIARASYRRKIVRPDKKSIDEYYDYLRRSENK